MSDTVKVVVKIRARSDKVAEARKLLLWLAEKSRNEHGCVGYSVLENIAEPSLFVLYEEWESQAELNAHGETEHVRQVMAEAPAIVAAAPERGVFRTVG
jgi:quinol monooxygenase YgiN